jgi:phosphocarrier protein HPr/phosphocarrier protein
LAKDTVTVTNTYGLHIRVATEVVRVAKEFPCTIGMVKDGQQADAKSIFQILALGAEQGAEITVSTEGEQDEAALTAVVEILTRPPEDETAATAGRGRGKRSGN